MALGIGPFEIEELERKMSEKLLKKLSAELRYMFGESAVTNLHCVISGEMDRFVGVDGLAIADYCHTCYGLKV